MNGEAQGETRSKSDTAPYGVQLLPSTQRGGPPETKSAQQVAVPASGKARAQSAHGHAVHGVAGAYSWHAPPAQYCVGAHTSEQLPQ